MFEKVGQITIVKTIADRLKEARLAKNLTQEDLARAAGVRQSTIGNVESGTRKNPRELLAIADALGVDAGWLKTGKASAPAPAVAAELKGSEPENWPFRSLSAARYAALPQATKDAIEAAVCKAADLPAPIDWRSTARSLAAAVDKQLRTDHHTHFVASLEEHYDELIASNHRPSSTKSRAKT